MARQIRKNTIREKTFRVGDEVKLKDYTGYSDYRSHDGQTATIIEVYEKVMGSGFDYKVLWKDGAGSSVTKPNLISFPGDWDE